MKQWYICHVNIGYVQCRSFISVNFTIYVSSTLPTYNISTIFQIEDLAQHVERGTAYGLFISCVSSSTNLWTMVIDAGTSFTSKYMNFHLISYTKVIL